jgi:hypothetical protein
LVSLLGFFLVSGGGLGWLEAGGGLGLVAGGGFGFFEVGGGLGLVADGGSVVGVGACCAKEVPSMPIAGDDALVTPCGGWARSGRVGAGVAGDSIGMGVEEPGGNSNGGSGGRVGALVEGGAARRPPPLTTVPGAAEWVGMSMSATAAARPAATMTMMISKTLRILTSGRLTLTSPMRQVLAGRRLLESLHWVLVHLQYAQAWLLRSRSADTAGPSAHSSAAACSWSTI